MRCELDLLRHLLPNVLVVSALVRGLTAVFYVSPLGWHVSVSTSWQAVSLPVAGLSCYGSGAYGTALYYSLDTSFANFLKKVKPCLSLASTVCLVSLCCPRGKKFSVLVQAAPNVLMLRQEVRSYATVRAWHRGSRRTTIIRSVQYLCYLADPL